MKTLPSKRLPILVLTAAALLTSSGRAAADGACLDPGHLRQTVLVILRFPPEGQPGALADGEEAHIQKELDAASAFLWASSNQGLRVQFHCVKFLESVQASDYKS